MDKSRPGHQAERLPLIIDRPDLAHPLRRVLAVVLTTLAWAVWFAMWIPLLFALGRHIGFTLPKFGLASDFSPATILALLHVLPYLIASAALILFAGWLREKYRAHIGYQSERWRPLGMERLASGNALDPVLLDQWQSARILYVEHGPMGRVTNAYETPVDHSA